MEQSLYLLISALSLTGFFVAFYIFRKKRAKRPLVCPMRANCDTVIHSEFSTFLGMPLELLGMGYYSSLALLYIAALTVVDAAFTEPLILAGLVLSAGAFAFSAYLTFLQAFILRDWCSWCLTSAAISTLIFFFSLYADWPLLPFS